MSTDFPACFLKSHASYARSLHTLRRKLTRMRRALAQIAAGEHCGCVCGSMSGDPEIPRSDWEMAEDGRDHHKTCPNQIAARGLITPRERPKQRKRAPVSP